MADYQQILARHSQVQYPPEVQAKLAEIQARHQSEDAHASDHGGS
jgi:hypothetical protein